MKPLLAAAAAVLAISVLSGCIASPLDASPVEEDAPVDPTLPLLSGVLRDGGARRAAPREPSPSDPANR